MDQGWKEKGNGLFMRFGHNAIGLKLQMDQGSLSKEILTVALVSLAATAREIAEHLESGEFEYRIIMSAAIHLWSDSLYAVVLNPEQELVPRLVTKVAGDVHRMHEIFLKVTA